MLDVEDADAVDRDNDNDGEYRDSEERLRCVVCQSRLLCVVRRWRCRWCGRVLVYESSQPGQKNESGKRKAGERFE